MAKSADFVTLPGEEAGCASGRAGGGGLWNLWRFQDGKGVTRDHCLACC